MNNIFLECFNDIKDKHIFDYLTPRGSPQHSSLDIIALVLFGTMSGARTCYDIEAFGRHCKKTLKEYLLLPKNIPSHDTINRRLSVFCSEYLEKSYKKWIKEICIVENYTLLQNNPKHFPGKKTLRYNPNLNILGTYSFYEFNIEEFGDKNYINTINSQFFIKNEERRKPEILPKEKISEKLELERERRKKKGIVAKRIKRIYNSGGTEAEYLYISPYGSLDDRRKKIKKLTTGIF